MAQENPIYNYLKGEGLTDLNESDFVAKYTDRENLQGVYTYLKDNGNTDLDFTAFADKYFPLGKAEEVSSQEPGDTSVTSEPQSSSSTELSVGSGETLVGQSDTAYATVPSEVQLVEVAPSEDSPISFSESVANSVGNIWNNLQGIDDDLRVVVGEGLKSAFGEEVADEFAAWTALYNPALNTALFGGSADTDVSVRNAVAELEALQGEMGETRGIIESIQSGDLTGFAAASIDALSALVSTAVVSVPTAGAGLFVDMGAQAITDYNKAKAESQGKTLQQLYEDDEAEFAIPFALGSLGAGLEYVGFKGATRAIVGKLQGTVGRKLVEVGLGANKEGATEWLQSGIEAVNQAVGTGITDPEELSSILADNLFSEQGLESYLQGVVGTVGAAGVSRMSQKLLSSKNREEVNQSAERLDAIQQDLNNPNLNPAVAETLQEEAAAATEVVANAIISDANLEASLSTEQQAELGDMLDRLEQIQEVLQDPNVSEATKQGFQDTANQISQEIDNLINEQQDGTESQRGVQGVQREGEGTEQSVQDQEGGAEAVETSGDVQASQEEVAATEVVEEQQAQPGQYFTRDIGGEQTVYRRNEDGTSSIVPDTEAEVMLRQPTETTVQADVQVEGVTEGVNGGVQQTSEFMNREQAEEVNTPDLEFDQEQVQEVTQELEAEGFTPEESTSFLQDITTQEGRTARKNAAADRIRSYWQSQQNLGISQEQNPEEFARFIKDVAEYAAVSLVDGTVRSARGLARALGVTYDDSIQQAFDQGRAIQQQIQSATVNVSRTTKQQIADATKGGVQGAVTVTTRQALADRFRSQNIGAKAMAQHAKDLGQTIRSYIDSQKARTRGRRIPASIVNRIANAVTGVTNNTQIKRALDLIDKAITNVEFRGKLEDIGNKQRAVRRASGNMPADRRASVVEFSRINPIDLPASMLDSYLNLLEKIPNTPRADVGTISNQDLQQYVDTAKLWHDKRMAEREERANEPSNKEAREARQQARIEQKQEQLLDLGLTQEEVEALTDPDGDFEQTLRNLEETLKDMTPSREDVLRNRTGRLLNAINANREEIRDSLPTEMAKRYFDEIVDNVTADNIPANKLVQANYALYNIAVEGSVVGTKYLIADSKAADMISKGGGKLATGFRKATKWVENAFNSSWTGAQGQLKIGTVINNAFDSAGEIADITGFTEYGRGQTRAFHKLRELADKSEKIITRHKGKWSNPVDKIRMSMYAIVAQYREGWTEQERADEYQGRWEGIIKSYDRAKNDPSSTVREKYKNLVENLEQLIQEEGTPENANALVVVTRDNEGKVTQVTPIYTAEELYEQLPEHYKEYYQYTQNFFQENKDDFITTREASDNKVLDKDWVNYYPLSYENIEQLDGPSRGSEIDFNNVRSGLSGSMTKETSGSGNARTIEGAQLPKSSIYNFGLLDSFLTDAGEMLYDINTSLERAVLNNTTDGRRNGLFEAYPESDIGSLTHYRNILYEKVVNDTAFAGFAFSERDKSRLAKITGSLAGIVRNIGISKALGGFMQAAKQVTPLIETIARLKSPKSFYTAMQLIRDPRARALLNEASVSMRDITRDHFGISQVSKQVYDKGYDNWVDRIGKVIEKGEDLSTYTSQISLWVLRNSDVAYANIGWLAMYIDKATDGGKVPLDLNTVDNTAFGYAENQNEIVMNTSDPSFKGAYSKNRFLPMVSPMLGFSINQVNSFMLSWDRMRRAWEKRDTKEIKYYSKELAANFLNSMAFQVIGASARVAGIMAAKYAGMAAYEAAKSWIEDDDEDDELKLARLNQLQLGHEAFMQQQEKAITRNLLNSADYFISDLLFRGLDLADITRAVTTTVTEPMYRAVLGDRLVDESDYGKGGAFKRPGLAGSMQALSEMTGVFGMGVNAGLEWADDIGRILVTQEDFIKATQGVPNAEGTEIIHDDWFLSEEGLVEFGKPDLAIGSEYLSLAVSTLGMAGLSDQTLNSFARNVRGSTKKVLKELRNNPKSEKQLDSLLKGVVDFDEIDLAPNIPYNPDPEEAGWIRAAYLNNVAEIRNKYRESQAQREQRAVEQGKDAARILPEDLEKALADAARQRSIAQFIQHNPHLRSTVSGPVKKAKDKLAREAELKYKRMYYKNNE